MIKQHFTRVIPTGRVLTDLAPDGTENASIYLVPDTDRQSLRHFSVGLLDVQHRQGQSYDSDLPATIWLKYVHMPLPAPEASRRGICVYNPRRSFRI